MENSDKNLKELIEFIQFIEEVGVKIRGIPDTEKILEITTKEFERSQKYDMLIFFLGGDGNELKAVATSLQPKLAKTGGKKLGFDLENFRIKLNKTKLLRQVVEQQKTLQITATQLANDLFPPEPSELLLKTIGYTHEPILLTPIYVKSQLFGVLVTVSTTLGQYLMPSVKNLAQHISNALERSSEYLKLQKAQLQIDKLNQYLESIIHNANVWLNVLDEKASVVIWNKAAEKISGFSSSEVVGHDKIWGWLYPDEEYRNTITQKAAAIIERGETVEDFETRIQRKDKHQRIISWNSRNLTDAQGRTIGSIALGRDITQHKLAETQLQKSLQEKELLLREIHHRVNSNMQIVSSLISLQSSYIHDPEIRDIFKDGQSRIRSLALVHEMLYRSGDLARVEFAPYIRDLSVILFQAYQIDPQEIGLNIQAEDVALDINSAIPCGLILNELISNALKHAFPQNSPSWKPERSHEIRIRFTDLGTEGYSLSVSDNGIGLPPDLDVQNTESLGLQLVNMLAYQLKSTLKIQRQPGTTFRLEFKPLANNLYS